MIKDVITRKVAKPGSPMRRSECEAARAIIERSQIISDRPTGSPLDACLPCVKIVRKKAANIALNQLCRRLCHAVRAQMCQISTLGDQTRVLPCGLILKVSA